MEGGASQHRKIELQAPDDLAYLLANVRRAAAARIDEAFPPVDGAHGEDELRTRIEELVNEYITQTFTLAAPNLSINGLSVEPSQFLSSSSSSGAAADPTRPEELYEPFDARKRARVEDLTREEEDLLRDIAALKKSVPGAAAAAWAEAARKSVREDEDALARMNDGRASAEEVNGGSSNSSGGGGGGGSLGIKGLERQADVEKSYEGAVQRLGRLKREMPSVVARMERARAAGEYVVTER
ncbi:hypothetical protein F5X99DRAFT_406491 [Biscogniauxia marginata]|nr:hypothetical protein F5X99DRAFT_406491 [Biscogniauxia marginata]